ncbi:MAG: flagellar FliJ family protein [Micrococcales bacterium]|nr:flagellar FliJ family protein [Micrococcales bacterium]MCL2667248.1 flagellar FliJ family protein [Micrococcales bacterium]
MARAFALAGLLRVRGIAEDKAAGALAAAHREENTVRERAVKTARMLADCGAVAPADAAAFRASVAARTALSGLLTEAKADVVVASGRTEERTEQWSVARRATRSVERLAERHDEQVRAADEHAEQVVLDEVGVQLHRRNADAATGVPR